MPAGFETYNDAGRLQLAAENSLFNMVSTGTVTTVPGDLGEISEFSVSYSMPSGGGIPIIAIAPAAFATLKVAFATSSGSNLQYGNYTATYNCELPVGSTVPYWIFDQASTEYLSYGLELRDAGGNIIYGVTKKPFRVVSSIMSNAEGSYTFTAGRQYAAAITSSAYSTSMFYADVYNPGIPYSADLAVVDSKVYSVKSINNGIQIQGRSSRTGFSGQASYNSGYTKTTNVIIVDVTDYGTGTPGGVAATATGSLTDGYYVKRVNASTSWTCTANISNATVSSYVWSIGGFGEGIGLSWRIDSGQGTATVNASMTVNDANVFTNNQQLMGNLSCVVTMNTGNILRLNAPVFIVWTGGTTGGGGGGGTPTFSLTPGDYTGDVSYQIDATSAVTWTYTKTGSGQLNSTSPNSGVASTQFYTAQQPNNSGNSTSCTVSVTATYSGGSAHWELTPVSVSNENCVAVDSYMPDQRRARDVENGDDILVLDYTTMAGTRMERVTAALTATEACVRITTISGISLVASCSTPVTLRDGSTVKITNSVGHEVAVQDEAGFRWEEIITTEDAGVREVRKITCGDGTYAAGEQMNRFIFTHNIKIDVPQN